jgi:predicted dehydrogenase
MPGFAIVGCGMIAGFHLKALSEIEGARVVAVVDSSARSLPRWRRSSSAGMSIS